jgi:ATP-binding cassette, subfamily B, bacterial
VPALRTAQSRPIPAADAPGPPADHGRVRSLAVRWPLLGLVGYAFRVAPALSLLTAASAIVSGLAPVGILLATGRMVNAVAAAVGAGLGSPAAHDSYRWIAVIAGLFFLTQVGDSARSTAGRALGRLVTGRLAERVMAAACEPTGIAHLEDPVYLRRIAAAGGGGTIEIPPGDAVFGFANKSAVWIGSIGSAALLAQLNWAVGLIAFGVFAGVYLRLARDYRIDVGETVAQAEKLRRARYLRDVPTTPAAAKEVRVFGLTPFFGGMFRAEWWDTMSQIWRRRREDNRVVVLVISVLVGLTVGGVFWFLGISVASGRMSVGGLAVGGLAVRNLLNLLACGWDDIRMSFGANAAAESFSFPAVTGPPAEARAAWPQPISQITCAEIGFRYPGQDSPALSDVTVSVPAGQSVAIVGLNGAGKTTLARILAGLDRPTSGTLSVGGISIDDGNRRTWQRQVAAVFQDFCRYELSAGDNIALGAPAYAEDREGVMDAAAEAGVAEFVDRFPHGWDTVLSSGFTDGVDLSGGEWQRIALARALFALRHGARLLILDEPAASLDVRAEARLYDTFHELTRGMTTVVISHRFATVRKAERVIVLDGGRVIEDGTHQALLEADQRYAELFRLQAQRFEESET